MKRGEKNKAMIDKKIALLRELLASEKLKSVTAFPYRESVEEEFDIGELGYGIDEVLSVFAPDCNVSNATLEKCYPLISAAYLSGYFWGKASKVVEDWHKRLDEV